MPDSLIMIVPIGLFWFFSAVWEFAGIIPFFFAKKGQLGRGSKPWSVCQQLANSFFFLAHNGQYSELVTSVQKLLHQYLHRKSSLYLQFSYTELKWIFRPPWGFKVSKTGFFNSVSMATFYHRYLTLNLEINVNENDASIQISI